MPSAHDAGSLRRGYVGIHTSGFKDFLLKPELMRAIQDCGFEHPSEGECAPSVVDAEPRSNPARREEFGPLEALGDPDGRKSAVAGPRTVAGLRMVAGEGAGRGLFGGGGACGREGVEERAQVELAERQFLRRCGQREGDRVGRERESDGEVAGRRERTLPQQQSNLVAAER